MAQPLFNVLADDPAFFVARGNTSGDILLLAFGMVLIPPTVLAAVEAVFLRSPSIRSTAHLVFVGLLTAVFVLQILADASPSASSALLIPVALLAGAGLAVGGWAAVPNEGGADRILVYVDGRLVGEGPPTTEREDVVKAVGAGTLKSGFELSGSDPDGGTPSRSDVHVFAIRGDAASEIR